MKKGLKIGVIILVEVLLLIIISIFGIRTYNNSTSNMKVKMRAIVVKVTERRLYILDKNTRYGLCTVGISNNGNESYKQGQEVLIYYDGMINSTYPGQINDVGKIEIVKEKSDKEIPERILRDCYSTSKNVNVKVAELTANGIHIEITDTNELQYEYSHSYRLEKEVKNEKYSPDDKGKVIEAPNNSSGTSAYIPPEPEYKYEEVDKKSNISTDDTEIIILDYDKNIIHRKFDWTELYGELDERKI